MRIAVIKRPIREGPVTVFRIVQNYSNKGMAVNIDKLESKTCLLLFKLHESDKISFITLTSMER